MSDEIPHFDPGPFYDRDEVIGIIFKFLAEYSVLFHKETTIKEELFNLHICTLKLTNILMKYLDEKHKGKKDDNDPLQEAFFRYAREEEKNYAPEK